VCFLLFVLRGLLQYFSFTVVMAVVKDTEAMKAIGPCNKGDEEVSRPARMFRLVSIRSGKVAIAFQWDDNFNSHRM